MAIDITNQDTGKSVRLWQPQESRSENRGEVRIDSIYGQDSDDVLLTGLEAAESVTLTGMATGFRLSEQAEYSSDPKTALAEWVAKCESLVNGRQGTGFRLHSDERDRTVAGIIRKFGWEMNQGEPFQVNWDIELERGNGMMAAVDTSPDPVNPTTDASLGGMDLGYLQSWRESKAQNAETYPIAFAQDAGENEVMTKSGAFRRIFIRGKIKGEVHRNQFDAFIRNNMGQDRTLTYSSGFPGRDLDVMVKSFESTREAGVTRLGEYNLEVVEGYSQV